MAKMFKVRDPKTKKIEKHTPQNANDLVQHRGWQIVGKVIDDNPEAPLSMAAEMQKKIDEAKAGGAPEAGAGDEGADE